MRVTESPSTHHPEATATMVPSIVRQVPVDPVSIVGHNQLLLFRNRPVAGVRMLRLLGNRKTLCDGISRRDLLHIGGLGAFGIALDDLLRLQRIQASPAAGPS